MKKCSRCKLEKELDKFYKEKRSSDGLNCACKDCVNEVNKSWLKNNPEKALENSRKSHERHRESDRKRSREYARKKREENPLLWKAKKNEWESKNPDKTQEIRKRALKKHYELHKISYYEKQKSYNEKCPERVKAHRKIAYAVKKGKIKKPERCQMCSSSERKIHAHHHDYLFPLEVIWVCSFCHGALHGVLNRNKKCPL